MALSPAEQAEELLHGLPERLDHTFRPWAQSAPNQPALIGEGMVGPMASCPGSSTARPPRCAVMACGPATG